MKQLYEFANAIKSIIEKSPSPQIQEAREIVCLINEFLYNYHDDIGYVEAIGQKFDYFSEFHKFWHKNHIDILECKIDDDTCRKVAIALHGIYQLTDGEAFKETWNTYGLSGEDVCRVRLFTANQDFRGSLDFKQLSTRFRSDNSIFDENAIIRDPSHFISAIGLSNRSQSDKRTRFARNIASFVIERNCSPIDIIKYYDNDVSAFREALINSNSGYGNKKTDMFIRDMVVLGIWPDVRGFETIDVASDVNTMKVALRTGILTTAIPPVSSFLDIFCYQYAHIEQMTALAWRRVWEIWQDLFPDQSLSSPCLLDYFVYKVVGKQFCQKNLSIFKCSETEHTFRWHSTRNRTCQVCNKEGKYHVRAEVVDKVYPCCDPEGEIAILQSDFVTNLPEEKKITTCPFSNICLGHKHLNPPKSISIKGQTGWETAYALRGDGGGGLMS